MDEIRNRILTKVSELYIASILALDAYTENELDLLFGNRKQKYIGLMDDIRTYSHKIIELIYNFDCANRNEKEFINLKIYEILSQLNAKINLPVNLNDEKLNTISAEKIKTNFHYLVNDYGLALKQALLKDIDS